jgi:hypothetical protein
MTKEKWREIVKEEQRKAETKAMGTATPEKWPVARESMLDYIAEIDKATEVYNLENTTKSRK